MLLSIGSIRRSWPSGSASVRMTLDAYSHVVPTMQREVAGQVGKRLYASEPKSLAGLARGQSSPGRRAGFSLLFLISKKTS